MTYKIGVKNYGLFFSILDFKENSILDGCLGPEHSATIMGFFPFAIRS